MRSHENIGLTNALPELSVKWKAEDQQDMLWQYLVHSHLTTLVFLLRFPLSTISGSGLKGVIRKYGPDFNVKLSNGVHLILETKGKDDDQNKVKSDFLDEWIRALNAHGGFGKWPWVVSMHPNDLDAILGKINVGGKKYE